MVHTDTFVVSCILAFVIGMIFGALYNQWFDNELRRDKLCGRKNN